MLTELQDARGINRHSEFQEWRRHNPTGVFLSFETKAKANLHGANCQHLGNSAWTVDPANGRNSLTKARKIIAETELELTQWAAKQGIVPRACKHCLRDGLLAEPVPESRGRLADPNTESAQSQSLAAIEGQVREYRALTYKRNAALRTLALTTSLGVCEGCGTDFSRLFEGLGWRVLQVHHKEMLARRTEESLTKPEDLAVLCANCHALVHADLKNPISVEKLRIMYSQRKRDG